MYATKLSPPTDLHVYLSPMEVSGATSSSLGEPLAFEGGMGPCTQPPDSYQPLQCPDTRWQVLCFPINILTGGNQYALHTYSIWQLKIYQAFML